MQTYLDCLPCLVRQTIEAVRMASDDAALQENICRLAMEEMSRIDFSSPPPLLAQQIHRLLRRETGGDPYREAKEQANHLALSLLPRLEEKVRKSAAPLETALRLAIAGNIIDMGVGFSPQFEEKLLYDTIDHALGTPFKADIEALSAAVEKAETILYLIDNAGEIVFDRLLIALLPMKKITAVVKSTPIINDATMTDAETAGLPKMVRVRDNGSDAPGTVLASCSPEFLDLYQGAELIIAKGQAHYETLNEENKDIFFLLKAKCPVVAEDLQCHVGDMVLRRSRSYGG
ncbi:MAG: DUF89 family protein [Deltaproteobacteria bacterium]|nr:DUF89 family protein [Deltaproteobacteria bacterium]